MDATITITTTAITSPYHQHHYTTHTTCAIHATSTTSTTTTPRYERPRRSWNGGVCVVVRVVVRMVVLGVCVVVCVVRVVGRMVVVVVASRARGSSHFGLSRCGPAGFSFPTHPTLEMSLRGLKLIMIQPISSAAITLKDRRLSEAWAMA